MFFIALTFISFSFSDRQLWNTTQCSICVLVAFCDTATDYTFAVASLRDEQQKYQP